MANNPDGLPTRGELIWKRMCAGTEPERQMAERLLKAGLFVESDEHPTFVDRRLDSSGQGIESSPMGALIKSIVDSQPEEGPFCDYPGADEPTPPVAPAGNSPADPLIPIPPDEELRESMKRLMGIYKPPEPPPESKSKYYVAPKVPPKPSSDLQPLSWEDDFDSNRPLR
jgi:hypothetical protein